MNETVVLIIGFIVFFVLMIICTVVYNAIAKAAKERKDNIDRAAGAYRQSKQENLADRFK